jgi:hypothetical protein
MKAAVAQRRDSRHQSAVDPNRLFYFFGKGSC